MLRIEVKLAKTIFGLKNYRRKQYSEARKGGLAMPLTSQDPLPSLPLVTKWPVREWTGRGSGRNPLAKNSEPHLGIKY